MCCCNCPNLRFCKTLNAGRFFSAKADFSTLVRSLPLDVMMPVNSGLTLTLPTGGGADKQQHLLSEVVSIAGIKDEVELLPSLQKPKKV